MPKQDLIFLELVPKKGLGLMRLKQDLVSGASHVPKTGLGLMCLKQDLVSCA